jgi:hypothetical protein
MLADATRSARAVAEQFAADSHSQLGPIRRANQGVFQMPAAMHRTTRRKAMNRARLKRKYA